MIIRSKQNKKIMIRSIFYGWRSSKAINALEFAKHKINNMPGVKTKEDGLIIINKRLKGIQFSLNELLK